ncbi:MAG: VOC family protein [Acidobacteria bacterium]|nr:VOC family protein [Acidobacteriota bacterium]
MQPFSRRRFLLTASATLAAARISRSATQQETAPKLLDHILIGSPDLDQGIAFIENVTGVRAAFGGVHPGAGTQNALLSLGKNRYLEIIAPDPKQPNTEDKRNLRKLEEPVIVGWAQHPGDIEAFAQRIKSEGFDVIGPQPGSRKRSDGRVLHWKTLALKDDAHGLFPFFIEWGAGSMHPSIDAPQGCTLDLFEAFTREKDLLQTRQLAGQLNLDLKISPSRGINLRAIVAGPKGRLEITF